MVLAVSHGTVYSLFGLCFSFSLRGFLSVGFRIAMSRFRSVTKRWSPSIYRYCWDDDKMVGGD